MAIYGESIADIELSGGSLFRSFSNVQIGEGDINADRFGVRVYRNKVRESLAGCTVYGYFIRPDGITVTLNGEVSDNTAFVTLTDECYARAGNFCLAIKIIGGGATGTMRIVDGTVVNTTTSEIVDPTGVIPDIDELLAVIDRAEDAAEDIAGFSVYAELIEGDDYSIVISTQ